MTLPSAPPLAQSLGQHVDLDEVNRRRAAKVADEAKREKPIASESNTEISSLAECGSHKSNDDTTEVAHSTTASSVSVHKQLDDPEPSTSKDKIASAASKKRKRQSDAREILRKQLKRL